MKTYPFKKVKLDVVIEANDFAGTPVDIWVFATSALENFSYQWGNWYPGITHAAWTGGLLSYSVNVLDRTLPVGHFFAYLAIDLIPKGNSIFRFMITTSSISRFCPSRPTISTTMAIRRTPAPDAPATGCCAPITEQRIIAHRLDAERAASWRGTRHDLARNAPQLHRPIGRGTKVVQSNVRHATGHGTRARGRNQ